MNTLTQSVLSTAENLFQVVTTTPGGSYDPTTDTAQVAFTTFTWPPSGPTGGAWITGDWQTFPGPSYWVAVLVGPANGGTALAIGRYHVWVKVTGDPEVPVLLHSVLAITP